MCQKYRYLFTFYMHAMMSDYNKNRQRPLPHFGPATRVRKSLGIQDLEFPDVRYL